MTEYEMLYLLVEIEKAQTDYGQYLIAAETAFTVSIYLAGRKKPKLVLEILSALY